PLVIGAAFVLNEPQHIAAAKVWGQTPNARRPAPAFPKAELVVCRSSATVPLLRPVRRTLPSSKGALVAERARTVRVVAGVVEGADTIPAKYTVMAARPRRVAARANGGERF